MLDRGHGDDLGVMRPVVLRERIEIYAVDEYVVCDCLMNDVNGAAPP